MTEEKEWELYSEIFSKTETAVSSRRPLEIWESPGSETSFSAAIDRQDQRIQVSAEELAKIWGISVVLAKVILSTTSQRRIHTLSGPIVF